VAEGASAILFDFDGTLADTFPRAERILPRLARELRFCDPGPDGLRRLRELPAGRILRELGIPWWKAPLAVWRARALMASDTGPVPFFPGVGGMLRELDGRGIRWGIVTTNGHAFVRRCLLQADLPEPGWLEAGIGLRGKARRIRRFLSRWGLDPAEVVLVSDEVRDLRAAEEAGIGFRAVGWGYNTPSALEAAGAGRVYLELAELARELLPEAPAT